MNLWKWFLCWVGHDWTSRSQEGKLPVPQDMPQPGDTTQQVADKFRRFATMYCRRCGKVYVSHD